MRYAAFTIDVDRDANLAERGRYEAGSRALEGSDTFPRFASSEKGLRLIAGLLKELDIRGTFFLEGDALRDIARHTDVRSLLNGHEIACHGVCHEDFTGESTGICLSGEQVGDVARESRTILHDILGRKATGFRAPYQHIDAVGLGALAKSGFSYDSSLTENMIDGKIGPRRLDSGIMEVPLACGKDGKGKRIVSYLWPMHEGKRSAGDYLELAASFRSGLLVLATHSWHLAETFARGPLDSNQIDSEVEKTRQVLAGILDQGIRFVTIEDFLRGG
ncbi:MAG: polysaccharide deacetylase family protein [Methanomassiliicoccales archaeon]|nr:polysaccharide deacetylase family protein [Methanomassiliicoccales archaeon]